MKARSFWVLATTLTAKVRVALVLVAGSMAVTMIVDVSPGLAWVASTWITPLGLAVESEALLIRIGETGASLLVRATLVIWVTMPFGSATTWPKIVCLKSRNLGDPVVMKNWVSLVSGPELAIASWSEPVKASCWTNSSTYGVP